MPRSPVSIPRAEHCRPAQVECLTLAGLPASGVQSLGGREGCGRVLLEQCGLFHRSPRRLWWRNPCRVGAHTRRLGGITRFYTPDPAFNAAPSNHFQAEQEEELSSRHFGIHEDEMREAWMEWAQFVQKPSAGNSWTSQGKAAARCKIECLPPQCTLRVSGMQSVHYCPLC